MGPVALSEVTAELAEGGSRQQQLWGSDTGLQSCVSAGPAPCVVPTAARVQGDGADEQEGTVVLGVVTGLPWRPRSPLTACWALSPTRPTQHQIKTRFIHSLKALELSSGEFLRGC